MKNSVIATILDSCKNRRALKNKKASELSKSRMSLLLILALSQGLSSTSFAAPRIINLDPESKNGNGPTTPGGPRDPRTTPPITFPPCYLSVKHLCSASSSLPDEKLLVVWESNVCNSKLIVYLQPSESRSEEDLIPLKIFPSFEKAQEVGILKVLDPVFRLAVPQGEFYLERQDGVVSEHTISEECEAYRTPYSY